MPIFGLLVQFSIRIVRVNISSFFDGHNVTILGENFQGDWAMELVFLVLLKVKLYQVFLVKGFSSERIGSQFFKMWHNV